MAEELFHGGVCGGGANWWNNSTRNTYSSSSLCSSLANRDLTTMNMKSTTGSSDADSASDGSCSSTVVIQDVLKPNQQTLQMVGISPDDHWINNQDLLHNNNGRSDQNYSNILDSSMNYWQENDWISATSNLISQDSNSVINSLNQTFDQLNSSNGFPLMNSASYSSYDSSLLQTLFDDTDSNSLRTQQSLLDNREFNYSTSVENYQVNSNEFLPMENPSFAKQQQLWNSTAADLSTNVRSSFLPSWSQSQFLPSSLHCKKPNLPSFSVKNQNEEASGPKKESNEPSFKRPRIETPSPLPTFKVRKEKLGDRITALQQLVSPFGKTDTASVLHEAIEYIKFLHDQVNELSSPYLKHRPVPVQRLQAEDKEGVMEDLKTRGLCLVPVTSTFPVAQTPADFWTPTFGGSFK